MTFERRRQRQRQQWKRAKGRDTRRWIALSTYYREVTRLRTGMGSGHLKQTGQVIFNRPTPPRSTEERTGTACPAKMGNIFPQDKF
jgi:hypothetical protein